MDIGTVLASVPKLPGHLLTIHGVVCGTVVAVVGVAGPVFNLLGPVPFLGVDNVLGDDDDVQEDLFFLTAGPGGVPLVSRRPGAPDIASLLLFIGDSLKLSSKFCSDFCPNLKGSLAVPNVPDSFPHPSYLSTSSRTVFVFILIFFKINVSLCCLLFFVFRLSTLFTLSPSFFLSKSR